MSDKTSVDEMLVSVDGDIDYNPGDDVTIEEILNGALMVRATTLVLLSRTPTNCPTTTTRITRPPRTTTTSRKT